MIAVALRPHPSTPCALVRSIAVHVERQAAVLTVSFRLDADLDRLRIRAPAAPRRGDRLWEHTCFEVFIAADDAPPYHELNFAPSGEWAAYAFGGYRRRAGGVDESLAPEIASSIEDSVLQLAANLALDRLSAVLAQAPLRVGLSAVVESAGGGLSYWALHHPAGAPDFHHPEAFVLRLE